MIPFLRDRWKRLLILTVLVVAGVFGFRPAMDGVRSWRGGRLLAEAQAAAGQGDWAEVRRAAAASSQL